MAVGTAHDLACDHVYCNPVNLDFAAARWLRWYLDESFGQGGLVQTNVQTEIAPAAALPRY